MEFKHTSVLLKEILEGLNIKGTGIYTDGTLGGGGHAEAICQKLSPQGTLIGIDRDKEAIAASKTRLAEYKCRLVFVQSNYAHIKSLLRNMNIKTIDGAVLDLGVSSFQIENSERGFSYMWDAPLDMRMNRDDILTAEQVINTYSEKELTDIIKKYGEEKWAGRIAKFIVSKRAEQKLETTYELVNLIKSAIPAGARREGPHPAKRTFQAIRIEVNEELSKLRQAIEDFCDVLAPGGRLAVIAFHSLEDRIVKEVFNRRANPCTCPKELPRCICGLKADIKKITGKPVVSGKEELERNPRARSAKLRIIEKI